MSARVNMNSGISEEKYQEIWIKPSIRIGVTTILITIFLSFLPCLYLYIKYGAFPSLSTALTAWGMIAMIFGAFYFVEPFSYYPILGMTGTYMAFLSGNIANIRLPASATAQATVGVENGTKQGEIISTLGIAGSIITNLVILTLAVLVGAAVMRELPPEIEIALKEYILPALFGALFGQFTVSNPKIALYALPLSLVVMKFTTAPVWIIIIVAIFGTTAISRFLYKKGIL